MRKLDSIMEEVMEKHGLVEEPLNRHVSLYTVERRYGGAEEGGWYYDWNTLVRHTPCVTAVQAERIEKEMQKEMRLQDKTYEKERHSRWADLPDPDEHGLPVNGEGDYIPRGWSDGHKLKVVVEKEAGSHSGAQNEDGEWVMEAPYYC